MKQLTKMIKLHSGYTDSLTYSIMEEKKEMRKKKKLGDVTCTTELHIATKSNSKVKAICKRMKMANDRSSLCNLPFPTSSKLFH